MRRASRPTGRRAASRSQRRLARSGPTPWRCRCGTACTGRTTRARRSASCCAPRRCALSWSDRTMTAAEPMKQPYGLQRVEVERDVVHRRRQDAARGAARQVAVEACARRSMPPQYSSISSWMRDAGRRELDARALRRGPRPRTSAGPCGRCGRARRTSRRPCSSELAHPVQRLEVVLERRPAEQAHLGDVRRAQARHAALAFDRFDHRRLFAADVGAGAAAQDGSSGMRGTAASALQRRRARPRASRGSRGTRRAGRRRSRRCRPPRPRSACLRGSGAGRARGRRGP
mgnify:CR=1 FL=1